MRGIKGFDDLSISFSSESNQWCLVDMNQDGVFGAELWEYSRAGSCSWSKELNISKATFRSKGPKRKELVQINYQRKRTKEK